MARDIAVKNLGLPTEGRSRSLIRHLPWYDGLEEPDIFLLIDEDRRVLGYGRSLVVVEALGAFGLM